LRSGSLYFTDEIKAGVRGRVFNFIA
jgi:hypothetical protein